MLATDFNAGGDLMAASNLAVVTRWDTTAWMTIGTVDALHDVDSGQLVGTQFPSSSIIGASIAGDGGSSVTEAEEYPPVWPLDPDGWPGEPYRGISPQWNDNS